jgi:hypothetical protein
MVDLLPASAAFAAFDPSHKFRPPSPSAARVSFCSALLLGFAGLPAFSLVARAEDGLLRKVFRMPDLRLSGEPQAQCKRKR